MDDAAKYPATDNRGPLLLVSAWILHAITLTVFAIRLWSRLRPKFALTAADYTVTVAVICRTMSVTFTTLAVSLGFGQHVVHIPSAHHYRIKVYVFCVFLFSALCSGFARVSIACLLLQFTQKLSWRIAIIGIIVLQALMMSLYVITQLVQCSNLVGTGSGIPGTKCLPPSHVRSFTYAQITVAMFSDLICGILPILLIRSLTRSTVEKVLTSILLASCLFASGIGIAKIYYQATYDFSSKDSFYLQTFIFFWSRLEEALIIIAACAPLLKQPLESWARKWVGFRGFGEVKPRSLPTIKSLESGESTESSASSQQTKSKSKSIVVEEEVTTTATKGVETQISTTEEFSFVREKSRV